MRYVLIALVCLCGITLRVGEAGVQTLDPAVKSEVVELQTLALKGKDRSDFFATRGAKRSDAWRRAAEQGFAEGQYLLACSYVEGTGVPKDAKEAIRW